MFVERGQRVPLARDAASPPCCDTASLGWDGLPTTYRVLDVAVVFNSAADFFPRCCLLFRMCWCVLHGFFSGSVFTFSY